MAVDVYLTELGFHVDDIDQVPSSGLGNFRWPALI
jgi:hypothetical protein